MTRILNSYASLLAISFMACRGSVAEDQSPPNESPSAVVATTTLVDSNLTPLLTTTEPAQGDLELTGVAAAARNTRLSTKAGGILVSIKVREGAKVQAGQILCSLDTTDLKIRYESAQVALAQAVAGAQSAAADLKRAEELFKGGATTDQALEKAQLGFNVANLQVDAAKVAVRAALQMLNDANLRAPFGGVITKVLAEEGQMVTTMPPTVIFVLADISLLEARVSIPERLLGKVRLGQEVVVNLPAVNIERKAKVDRIPEVIDPTTRSVEAVIRLDNRDHALPAGLFARVRFVGVQADSEHSGPTDNERPLQAEGPNL